MPQTQLSVVHTCMYGHRERWLDREKQCQSLWFTMDRRQLRIIESHCCHLGFLFSVAAYIFDGQPPTLSRSQLGLL